MMTDQATDEATDEIWVSHRRRQIRDYVVALLSTGIPAEMLGAEGVGKSRVRDFGEGDLPAILVYTREEDSTRRSFGELDRFLLLVIDIRVEATDELDDQADGLAAHVEKLMDDDPLLGGLVIDNTLIKTEIGLMGGQAVTTTGSAQLIYRPHYQTAPGQPSGD